MSIKNIFLPSLYPFIRVLVFMALVGCGSVQSINGVKYRKKATDQNVKAYVFVCTGIFGLLIWGAYNEKAIE